MASTESCADLKGAELLDECESRKERANGLYKRELYDPAIQVYLAAIWLLKPPARPSYPEVLAGQVPAAGADAEPLLGGWRGGAAAAGGDDDASAPQLAEREAALRTSLHLNVAACALKKADYDLARLACTQLLEARGENTKALYRLAQAHNGLGDTRSALRSVQRLLAVDKEHREARKLLSELRARSAAEKELYAGLSGKATKGGDGFGSSEKPSVPEPPDPNKKPEDPMVTQLRQMFGSGAMGPPPSARDDSDDDDGGGGGGGGGGGESAAEREARLEREVEEAEARREKFYAERSAKTRAERAERERQRGAAATAGTEENNVDDETAEKTNRRQTFSWFRTTLSLLSAFMAVFAIAIAYYADRYLDKRHEM